MTITKSFMLMLLLVFVYKIQSMDYSLRDDTVKQLLVRLYKTKQLPKSIYTLCKSANVYNITEQLHSFGFTDQKLIPYLGFSQKISTEILDQLRKSLLVAYTSDSMLSQSTTSFEAVLKAYIYKLRETQKLSASQYHLFTLLSIDDFAAHITKKYKFSTSQLINLFFAERFAVHQQMLLSCVVECLSSASLYDLMEPLVVHLFSIGELSSIGEKDVLKELAVYLALYNYTPQDIASYIAFRDYPPNNASHYNQCMEYAKEFLNKFQKKPEISSHVLDASSSEDELQFMFEL